MSVFAFWVVSKAERPMKNALERDVGNRKRGGKKRQGPRRRLGGTNYGRPGRRGRLKGLGFVEGGCLCRDYTAAGALVRQGVQVNRSQPEVFATCEGLGVWAHR